jgi:hypothetical protein
MKVKFKLGQKVIVNTGGKDTICHIDNTAKGVHGFYWKEQNSYLCRFTDDATKLICNGAISREQYIDNPKESIGKPFFVNNAQYIPAEFIREFKD